MLSCNNVALLNNLKHIHDERNDFLYPFIVYFIYLCMYLLLFFQLLRCFQIYILTHITIINVYYLIESAFHGTLLILYMPTALDEMKSYPY